MSPAAVPRRLSAHRQLAVDAYFFGFTDVDEYLSWQRLDGDRRTALVLRLGEGLDCFRDVLDGLSQPSEANVAGQVAPGAAGVAAGRPGLADGSLVHGSSLGIGLVSLEVQAASRQDPDMEAAVAAMARVLDEREPDDTG